ncbi:MAG: hypothetical protein ABI569_11320 [Casimicrobiaceae bacterium]
MIPRESKAARAYRVMAATLALGFISGALPTQAQDVRAIQISEARKSDERTLAYFDKFRVALIAKFGGDPLLSKIEFSEVEGEALVHASAGAPAEFVIYQTGQWISTDGRQLKPWAPDADPSVSRFRLSAVTDKFVRERFRAHRIKASQAADILGPVTVGYFGAPFNRLVLEVQIASMSTAGLSIASFDLATGAPLDVTGAIATAHAQREEVRRKDFEAEKVARQRNLVKEVPATLAQFRKDVGPARLMAVWIKRNKITFVQGDKVIVDYDQRGRFNRRPDPYDSVWLCTGGFDDREIDWNNFAALIEKAMLARNLDEEDRDYAEIAVERPRDCVPTTIEIKFSNYKSPQPSVTFDAAGRLVKSK